MYKENQENDYTKMIAVIPLREGGSNNLEGPGGKAPGGLAVLYPSPDLSKSDLILFSL